MSREWSEDRDAMLKKLWADGLSAAQIAAEMGARSRNAVIGRAHRLGLSRRAEGIVRAKTEQRKATRADYLHHKTARRVKAAAEKPATAIQFVETVSIDPASVPVEQRRTLLQLTPAVCHFPCGHPGEADFFFCGAVAMTAGPYCGPHHAVAYRGRRA